MFISYSREDKQFVEARLLASLVARGKKVWIDLEDIPPAADWRERIWDGIAAARAFVFVLSPASLGSQVCREELSQAVGGNKRVIPVLRHDVGRQVVPSELERPNWILLRDEDDFDAQLQRLVDAVGTDLDWVDMHALLAVRAREWDRAGQTVAACCTGATSTPPSAGWLSRVRMGRRQRPNRPGTSLPADRPPLAVNAPLWRRSRPRSSSRSGWASSPWSRETRPSPTRRPRSHVNSQRTLPRN